MRILVDATPLLLRSAGVKNYLYHWLDHLRRQAAPGSVAAFPFLKGWGPLTHEHSVIGPLGTGARLGLLYLANVPGSPLAGWIASGYDVFHVTNQIRRQVKRARLSATLHDLTALQFPELHTSGNVKADRGFTENVLKRADGLMAVSESSRQDAVRLLGLDPRRIEVIYPGVATAYFEAVPAKRPRPYVLFVGAIEPRKNLDALLDGWGMLEPDLREAHELVVAGPPGWASETTLARLRRGLPSVRYLGYVAERELPGLTAGASVFVYPSLYEGFGFPVVQAMAAGVPVVTSNLASLPEVTGGAALLVDPRSPSEIASAMARLLASPSIRADLAARARRRAQRFRWEECARLSLDFFRRLI